MRSPVTISRTGTGKERSVIGESAVDPALDLLQERGEWTLTGARREIRLAHVVERAGVVFEVLGELLKEQEPGPVEREIELGDGPVRSAALLQVIVERAALLDVGAKQ